MTSIADALCAIEARAERAIVQELRLMTQEILKMRTQLVLQDRNHADALLLKLDRLASDQTVAPANAADIAVPPAPSVRLDGAQTQQPVVYKAYFHDHECGDLEDVVTVNSFDAAVQLVIDRLSSSSDNVVEAAWNNGNGSMRVLTLGGTVLARVEAVYDADVAVHPAVMKACHALQFGDTFRIEQLFGLALMTA